MDTEFPHFTLGHGIAGVILTSVVWFVARAPWWEGIRTVRKGVKTVSFLDSVMERFDKMEKSVADSFNAVSGQMVTATELLKQFSGLASKQGELEGRQKQLEYDYNGLGRKLSSVEQFGHANAERIRMLEEESEDTPVERPEKDSGHG